MRKLATLLGLSAVLAAGGCASTGGGGTAYQSYNDCIFARTITDWRPLDNMNLVVFSGIRQAYHVQLTMRSMSLRFEDMIAFTDRDGRICPYGGDSVVVNGALRERIPIASIRRLTEGQLEELYRSYGISEPEVIEAPAPTEEAQ